MLVILTEEESMEVTLRALLPKLGIADFQIVTFQGVGDLETSLTRRIRAWRDPNARFLVIRDNENGNCRARKHRLQDLVQAAGATRRAKVRIVMQELEAWFLGDCAALEKAGLLAPGSRPAWLRDPETEAQPVLRLKKLEPGYGKVTGARRIAPHLDPRRNQARSFHATLNAIRELAEAEGA
jgi:hypothetical protein